MKHGILRESRERAASPRAGFTFVELLIVVAILGVLYSIGAINFQGLMPKYRLKSGAKRLATIIETVRMSAVNREAWMGIRYVLSPQEPDENPYYQIIPPAPADYPDQPLDERKLLDKEYLPEGVRFARVILANNQAIEDGAVNVLFSPMGNAGSHIAVLEGSGAALRSVKLNSLTGTIDIVPNGEAAFQSFEE